MRKANRRRNATARRRSETGSKAEEKISKIVVDLAIEERKKKTAEPMRYGVDRPIEPPPEDFTQSHSIDYQAERERNIETDCSRGDQINQEYRRLGHK